MSSSQAMHTAIRRRYAEQIVATSSHKTLYDGQTGFDKPTDALWVRMTILVGSTTQASLGATPIVRTNGVVTWNIFNPIGKGDKAARELGDRIAAKFRLVTEDDVRYQVPTITNVGVTDDWWQLNVTAPFIFDEIVTIGV